MEAQSCGWNFHQFRWCQDSIIVHARNLIAAKFMESGMTDLVCLDADIACGPGAFTRLMSHQVDFVGAVYRTKNDVERWPVKGLAGGAAQDPVTGLLEVKDIPFGFTRLTRAAVQKMVDAAGDDWFRACNDEQTKCHKLFWLDINDHTLWGEDFYFCRRWRELGGKVYVDPDIALAHINGDGKSFPGRFSDFLKRTQCLPSA